MTGQLLADRYQIQKPLSKDSRRATLMARDLTTQQSVVVKFLLCRSDSEAADLKLFQREAEILRTLQHPAIPRYLDDFELKVPDGRAYALVRSYIPGRSLQDHLTAGRKFSEPEVRQLATSLLEILRYLHNLQPPILHRDIKPSNILLVDGPGGTIGQVYLIDFSSVQNFASTATGSFTAVGTYGYTPPEQSTGHPVKASDLYSLGVTLVSAMTGLDAAKLPRKGMRLDLEALLQVSPALLQWFQQMTAPSLERRFASVEAALAALQPQAASPTTASVPVQSRVKLLKQDDRLDILIPQTFSSIRLTANSQQVRLSRELWSVPYRRWPTLPRDEIRLLACSPTRLTLATGSQNYELGQSQNLTTAEVEWLARELSQWLGLPITKAK